MRGRRADARDRAPIGGAGAPENSRGGHEPSRLHESHAHIASFVGSAGCKELQASASAKVLTSRGAAPGWAPRPPARVRRFMLLPVSAAPACCRSPAWPSFVTGGCGRGASAMASNRRLAGHRVGSQWLRLAMPPAEASAAVVRSKRREQALTAVPTSRAPIFIPQRATALARGHGATMAQTTAVPGNVCVASSMLPFFAPERARAQGPLLPAGGRYPRRHAANCAERAASSALPFAHLLTCPSIHPCQSVHASVRPSVVQCAPSHFVRVLALVPPCHRSHPAPLTCRHRAAWAPLVCRSSRTPLGRRWDAAAARTPLRSDAARLGRCLSAALAPLARTGASWGCTSVQLCHTARVLACAAMQATRETWAWCQEVRFRGTLRTVRRWHGQAHPLQRLFAEQRRGLPARARRFRAADGGGPISSVPRRARARCRSASRVFATMLQPNSFHALTDAHCPHCRNLATWMTADLRPARQRRAAGAPELLGVRQRRAVEGPSASVSLGTVAGGEKEERRHLRGRLFVRSRSSSQMRHHQAPRKVLRRVL